MGDCKEHSTVSIVVPVYNTAKYLRECLDSILNQTFKDIEVICVDDGSKDGSFVILREYEVRDGRVRVLTKENDGRGAAGARNLGMDNATGDYVLFLDGDDFFSHDMVERMVGRARETDADVVLCRAERYDDRIHKRQRDYEGINFRHLPDKEVFSYKDCPDRIFQIADWIVWNKLFRRRLLVDNGLRFEAIPISDDQYIPVLALVLAERISLVDEVMVHYRVNTGYSQVDRQAMHPEASYLATYSIVDRMREMGVYEQVKRSYLNNVIRVFREYFDRMTDYETLSGLYNRFRDVEFPRLEAENLKSDFFYDQRLAEWYGMVTTKPLEKILLEAARGHGDGMTTAVLRFKAPFEVITPGSRIVLIGRGRMGRYWYSQLILSERCEVVAWVDSQELIPEGMSYDQVLFAR